ncbi:MAG: quinolinate synthase NadA [Proteobacteria bacterium]|nr:quinolinate synthase NadA [Pseudomonadota bacterium]MBU1586045.1 quinolinate synthase NadA [Pseudomonadota bacterium]MBU2453686.1 quinolinate synthase NadA [Pseudomonadota bacterium]MBU2629743.1 quinolinate synthase NadA [Pseudomonadota bacterium]
MENIDKKRMEKIIEIKHRLGNKLVILTHHYQRKEIVDLGDHRGDSFGLSQRAAKDENAEYIIFCGVHFMAESAAILAKDHQTVQIPDMNAGCWMADMADSYQVEKAWNEVSAIVGKQRVTPLVYMNSDAYIKAHCGKNNGAVCTSSNALKAFEWALRQREKIFFFPDEHLGRNTGNSLGIPTNQMRVWDPEKPLGGNSESDIKNTKIFLWKGYCLVHTRFTPHDMETMRKDFPDAKIVVHPECTQEVVKASDAVGSTSFIVSYVADAPPGATIIIGTEINLIKRLAMEYPNKRILPLKDSFCPNMNKINLKNLLACLENIGKTNLVTVDESIKKDALIALENMLSL